MDLSSKSRKTQQSWDLTSKSRKTQQRETKTKLAILRINGTIHQSLYFKLKPTDSQAPRLYGLPKIHKASIPVRPIVSYSGSPLFNLSKYITNILKPYTLLNKQHCKNSKEFSEFIRAHTIEEDEFMVSSDVEALYTNVPMDYAVAIIKELLENDETLPDRTPLSPKTVLDVLEFLLRTTFIFNGTYYQQTEGVAMGGGTYYQQTEGVAMGGPPSSIVAEIYMQATETTALTTTSHPPKVWERHVDDVFSIVRKSNLHYFFQHINSLHPKTKFTMETEENSQLPFLDTFIQRNSDNTISIRVYRKPTKTDQYLKFTSHHLVRAKKNVIISLFNRAKNIISNPSNQEKEENHLTAVLQANGYPKKFINNTIRASQLPRQSANSDNTENQEQIAPVRINIPYVKGTSEQLKRIFNDHNIDCTFYTTTTLRTLPSQAKDPVPSEQRNNIVYKYDCKDCEAVYFGESKRTIAQRTKEHTRAVRAVDTRRYETADHRWKYNHDFDWENKKIMDYETNTTTKKIKETVHSLSNNNHINGISYRLPIIITSMEYHTDFHTSGFLH